MKRFIIVFLAAFLFCGSLQTQAQNDNITLYEEKYLSGEGSYPSGKWTWVVLSTGSVLRAILMMYLCTYRYLIKMRKLLRYPEGMSVEVNLVEIAFLVKIQETFTDFGMTVGAIAPFECFGTR